VEATERDDEPFNPYAPPESDLTAPRASVREEAGDRLWRAGNLLVMSKAAWLPDRCIRCNRPPAVRLDRNLRWHRPLIYLALLIHVLLYLVLALFTVKSARVRVPLCAEHNRARWARIVIGWGIVFLAFFLVQQGLTDPEWIYLVSLAPLVFLVGLLVLLIGRHPIPPKKIDDRHVWLKKVSPEILADLPDAPFHLLP
jgi:hypothetical protein